MTTPQSSRLIDKLLDDNVEISDIELSRLSVGELAEAIVDLRARVFILTSLVGLLSEQIRIVDSFARPRTSRYYRDPRKTMQ